MIVCPKCGSTRFFYVSRVYEYHYIDRVEYGYVELAELQDSVPDESYETKLWCEDCCDEFDVAEIETILDKTNVDKEKSNNA